MRFPTAAIFLMVMLFIAFVGFAVCSFILYTMDEQLSSNIGHMTVSDQEMFLGELEIIQLAFGVLSVMFFLIIIVVFVVDSLRDEPEMFYPPR